MARDIIARGMAANAAAGGGGGGGSDPATLPVVFSIEWDGQSDGQYGTATADQTISQIYQAQIDGLVVVGVYGYGSDSAMTSVSLDLVESTTEDGAASSVTFRGISSEHVTLEVTGTVNSGADAWVATSYAKAPELPTPTADDVGKYLTVLPSPSAIIAPEQRIEYEGSPRYGYVLTDINRERCVRGAVILCVVNGVELMGTLTPSDQPAGLHARWFSIGNFNNDTTIAFYMDSTTAWFEVNDGASILSYIDIAIYALNPSSGAVIAATQNATYDSVVARYLISATAADLFVPGANVVATIDNTSYYGTVGRFYHYPASIVLWSSLDTDNVNFVLTKDTSYSDDTLLLNLELHGNPQPQSVNISVNIANVEYAECEWAPADVPGLLPTPTASDVGKIMSVQPVGGTVIAPLQSGVPDDEGVVAISNFNTELFTVGATVLVEMNGEKMVGTVVSQISNGSMGVEFNNPLYSLCAVWVYNGNGYASALYLNNGVAPGMSIKVSLFDAYDWVETPPNTMIVHMDADGVFDKTWQEIFDAITSGKNVFLLIGGLRDGYGFISYYDIYFAGQVGENSYNVITSNASEFYCTAPDEYPFAD